MRKFSTVGRLIHVHFLWEPQNLRGVCVKQGFIYVFSDYITGIGLVAFYSGIKQSQTNYFRAGSLNRDATADSTAAKITLFYRITRGITRDSPRELLFRDRYL